MGYPDEFEGFMIEDHKKWTEFKKKTVRLIPQIETCSLSSYLLQFLTVLSMHTAASTSSISAAFYTAACILRQTLTLYPTVQTQEIR